MIREFRAEDFPACMEVVNRVWDFDGKFKPAALSSLFKDMYTGGALATSNFNIVVEEEGQVKGFLFGNCGRKNCFKNQYSTLWGRYRFVFQLFRVKGVAFKKKYFYLKILTEHEINRRKIEPKRENEVNLFALDPSLQGKGYGKQLMTAYIDFCRKNNVHRIALDTDKQCNYGFYDHLGFKVKGEFYSPLQKEYSGGATGDSYVYELIIE